MICDAIKLTLLVLMTFFVNIYGESEPKSSLVFVIDKTNSMGTVINAVKSHANAIFDTVARSEESPIGNFILVTFGDPNVSEAMITTNHDEFKDALSSIALEGGEDCPEVSLSGIKKGLEASLPGSLLFVFTDASAKDSGKLEEVKQIALEKDSQVVFVLTGKCTSDEKTTSTKIPRPEIVDDDVYLKLATATSGQVFNLLKEFMYKILRYVKDSVRSRRVILHAGKYPSGSHTVPFELDARTKDLTIAVSGSYPEATVVGPDGETVDADALVSLNEILVLKVNETIPGAHTVLLTSDEPSYIMISARSDIKFTHGFSLASPLSLDDTSSKPVPGGKNYLSIKLYGEKCQLTSAKFLSPTFHNLMEMPLKLIDEKQKLYTTNLVCPPKTPFRIAVKGIDSDTKTTITRYGRMLYEAEKFVNKNPTVNIEGDAKVTIEHGGSLKLKCIVNAYPEPRVIWRDRDGTMFSATETVREPPYNYISILELEPVNKNTTYECFAVNKLGVGKHTVEVEVKQQPYFKVLEVPADLELDYNAPAVLYCKVDAFPPAKVTWSFYPTKTTFSKWRKFETSLDGSTLTIEHMQPSASGVYVCKAENGEKRILAKATVTITARTPKINMTTTEYRVKEGESAVLNCSIIEGNPKPGIKWYRKPAFLPSAKYKEIKGARNLTTISLIHLNRYDTAIYKCRADNVMGMAKHYMDLFVECPPTIMDDINYIVAKKGEEIFMTCIVQGVPMPTPEEVVWLKDGAPLGSEVHRFRDHMIKFIVDLHHSGLYTCTATNKLGFAQRTVEVLVSTLHIDAPLISKLTVKRGSRKTLKCPAEGDPEPSLQWMYFSFDKAIAPKTLKKGNKLVLSNIKESQRGYYTCVASNVGGSLNISYEVDVMFPPKIPSDIKLVYDAVDGDRVLKVHCRAIGNPKPEITWQKGGTLLAEGDRYIMEDDWLIIKNVQKSDTAGEYDCLAKNKYFGTSHFDYATFLINVDRSPSAELISSTTTLLIKEGEVAEITCFVPHKNVDTVVWYKDGAKYHEGILILDKAKASDSGVYTCRVNHQDLPTIETANTKVNVGSKPKFVTEEKRTVELEFGQFGFLNCKVMGDPTPTVLWWHNSANIGLTEMVYNFIMDATTVGEYICEVTNDFGSVSRTFDVTSKGCRLNMNTNSEHQPLMVTIDNTWPAFEVIDGFTIVPKGYKILFSCPKRFTNFDQTELTAQCESETKLYIDGTLVEYTDIRCKTEVKPRETRKRKLCHGEDTETVKSVFTVNHKTIEVFDACVDRHGNSIYLKHTMKSPAGYIPKDLRDDSKYDSLYRCRNQEDTFSKQLGRKVLKQPGCCFARRHLINPRDVFPGPPQRATVSSLNIVPHWSSCHGENWNEVEERVRNLARSINNDLIVYTGTIGHLNLPDRNGNKKTLFLSQKTNQPIPLFLWKVIQCPINGSSLAVVQLNNPEVLLSEVDGLVYCTDICEELPWIRGPDWHSIQRGYTYCCELKEFEIAFWYRGVFEPHLSDILNITIT